MSVNVELKPLGELLAEGFSKSSLRRAFSRFACERDPDVRRFLNAHAIQNELTGASRTYLVLSGESLGRNELAIVAFLTVAITVTDYREISVDERIAIMGKVPGVGTAGFFPGYLVAQLARDDNYSHEDFDASELLPFAEDLMLSSMRTVGGRLVYLDCKEELLGYYERQGYAALYLDEKKGLYKLVKTLG